MAELKVVARLLIHDGKLLTPFFFLLGMLILGSGCSDSDDPNSCDSSSIISSADNICLRIEHDRLSNDQKALIEEKITIGITTISSLMPINDLRIRIVGDQQLVIPEIGLGGYNPNAQEVLVAVDVNFNNIEESIEENLIPLLAHEVHHAKRRRSVGYGSTLLQAVITEGLADHFSIEVTGISPPPWSVALSDSELQSWIDTASDLWDQPYNHGAWFLGTDPNIPRWTGYSIGFELVNDYLLNNPGESATTLNNEPATTFRP